MRRFLVIFFLIIIFVVANIFIYSHFKILLNKKDNGEITYGITFSKIYAEDFGLNWKEAYLAMLDDLGVKQIRLPVYWNLIEPEQDKFNFRDMDWQIDEAEKRGARIILTIGRRAPRWPECFVPNWAKDWNEVAQQERVFKMLREVVLRYKERQIIWAWQIENEPFLNIFGECPSFDKDFLEKEIELVKSIDDKPIIITESGELSTWFRGANYADILGVSLYRVVWNDHWGYFHHIFPTLYYDLKGWIVGKIYKTPIFVSEMQAEPWGRVPNPELSIAEQLTGYSISDFEQALNFVKGTGFKDVYFWGVEWWYWLKEKQGNDDFWERGKELFQ